MLWPDACHAKKIRNELQGTASETVLVALLAAQAKVMADRPASDRQRLVCYSSDQVRLPLLAVAMLTLLATKQMVSRLVTFHEAIAFPLD